MTYQILSDISLARTLPSEYYRNEKALELLKERILPATWQFVGYESQCPEPGFLYPLTMLPGALDEPLVLSRSASGKILVLSNVCTHRGSLLIKEPCKRNEIVCPYHGRRFSLSGEILSMPYFQQAKNFPGASDNLESLPVSHLGEILFTSLKPLRSFQEIFKPMLDILNWFDFSTLKPRPDLSACYHINAHWALYVENYLEGFHIPFVHKGLHSVLDFSNYRVEVYDQLVLQWAPARDSSVTFSESQAMREGKKVAAYYFWIFPNVMMNFYPWGLSMNIVVPQNIEHTLVYYHTLVRDNTLLGKGAGADLQKVEFEDQAIVELVQKGIKSRLYVNGRYSPDLEIGTHYFHRLLCEVT